MVTLILSTFQRKERRRKGGPKGQKQGTREEEEEITCLAIYLF